MVTAMVPVAGFAGEMDRPTVLEHYWRLREDGIGKDAAISQTLDAIIYGNRAAEFVRAFGGTIIKGMITSERAPGHPANAPALDCDDEGGHLFFDTHTKDAAPSSLHTPDHGDGDGHERPDTQSTSAVPSPPEPIVQGFPRPGTGRVFNIAKLRDPSILRGVLAAGWSVDGADVPLGLMTREQCFTVSKRLTKLGKTQITNGTMFRRLGQSLDPGQVVADRWDEAGVMEHFRLAEPNLDTKL